MLTNEQITKRQHYLPKMYLKNFTDETGKLWKKDLNYGKYSKKSPTQICYKEFLYETPWKVSGNRTPPFAMLNYLENYFSSRESVYKDCISAIIKKLCGDRPGIFDITDNERKILAEFTANLFLRHPHTMDVIGLDKTSEEDAFRHHAFALKQLFGVEAETVIKFERKCQWLDSRFPGGYFQDVQKLFENMRLTFFVSKSREFVTCDWPFLCALQEGCFIVFILPLTPNCCICYSRLPVQEKVTLISDEMIVKYNKLHIEKASSYITSLFARNKEDIEVLFE